jgi:hypothetical protein
MSLKWSKRKDMPIPTAMAVYCSLRLIPAMLSRFQRVYKLLD